MVKTTLALVAIAIALALAGHADSGDLAAAEFDAQATALPFPPDARNLEFVAWAGDIKYTSQSPLNSLAAFYLKEMALRGWEHDEAAAEIDGDSINLTFQHGDAKVKLALRQSSKELRVSLDCKGLEFTGTGDPAKLAAAGIPVPRATLVLQKSLPLPADPLDLQYTADGCTFKSSLKLPEAFDHFMRLAPSQGFRESRRPIVTDTRRYTELKKGSAQLSVNVFTDPVGSRIVLTYKDEASESRVPPLPAVASLPLKNAATAAQTATGKAGTPPVGTTPIDVASNKGSATVSYNGKQYTFANVACFQTKSRGADATTVVYSSRPIPFNKMQSLIATKNDFSFSDLFEFGWPDHLILQLGEYLSFSFSVPGVGISSSVENPVNEMKVDAGRVKGTLKMPPKDVFSGETFSFMATADAAIITPSTRITGPGDPVARSDNPSLADSPVPFPEGVENAGREGSRFRKTYNALVGKPLAEVTAFYESELAAKGWQRPDSHKTGDTMQFNSSAMELAVTLKDQRGKTAIEIVTRDMDLAKREGILPQSGKGRLVLGNANNVAVAITIGNTSYSLRPGQGAQDYKQALNFSLAPGTYNVLIRIPGQPQVTEKIDLREGMTWGIIVLPMGGCLPVRLY